MDFFIFRAPIDIDKGNMVVPTSDLVIEVKYFTCFVQKGGALWKFQVLLLVDNGNMVVPTSDFVIEVWI